MAGIDTLSIQNVIHYGDSITLTVKNLSLPGGQESVSYTLVGGGNFYTGLTAAINSDANLQAIGYTATTSTPPGGSTLMYFYQSPINITTYTATTSSGATESVSLGVNNSGSIDVAVKGTTTTGDTITLSATNPGVSSPINVTYTVTSTDSLISIASNIAALINSNTSLQSFQLSASNTAPGNLLWSESFQTAPLLSGGKNLVAVTGQDGSGIQKTNQFPLSTSTNAAQSLTYDLNGNITSDGTNSYAWDAENRLIQINYPGSANNSQFAYDGRGHRVQILETTGGTITSTKQFIESGSKMCEARDVSGVLLNQYFPYGQTISTGNYFYTQEILGSIKELTDSSGMVQARYVYDPYGRAVQDASSTNSDFRYAGYYLHGRSGLNITQTRAYNSSLGRFLNRDILGEIFGNRYAYAVNNPVSFSDPSGLRALNANEKQWVLDHFGTCIDPDKIQISDSLGGAGLSLGDGNIFLPNPGDTDFSDPNHEGLFGHELLHQVQYNLLTQQFGALGSLGYYGIGIGNQLNVLNGNSPYNMTNPNLDPINFETQAQAYQEYLQGLPGPALGPMIQALLNALCKCKH